MLPLELLNRVACFETLRAYEGKIFCLRKHLERLSDSCIGLGRCLPSTPLELERWVLATLKESSFPDARLRLSVHWQDKEEGILLLMIWEFKNHPKVWYEKGVKLAATAVKRWNPRAQDPQIKSSMFVSGVLAISNQGKNEAHELIFLTQEGNVSEGTVSNIFIVKERRLLTPAVSSGILRGVTRGAVIELAGKRGLEVKETPLLRHDIYNAEECFITNTSSEILPVISVDDRLIADGRPGPVTKGLAKDFKVYVRRTLGKKSK